MDNLPIRTLTKKELCIIFGLSSPSGRTIYYKKLRSDYFTDEALEKMGISHLQYASLKGGKPFTFAQTCSIIQHFNVSIDELKSNLRPIAA